MNNEEILEPHDKGDKGSTDHLSTNVTVGSAEGEEEKTDDVSRLASKTPQEPDPPNPTSPTT